MTTRDDLDRTPPEFDRLMTAWFDTEARVRIPDDLLERALTRSSSTRPLPAWLLPERWLPMQLTMRRARLPQAMRYVALLVILAVLAVAAVAIVGSRPRIPAPFGPADNGAVAYVDQGRVAALDPATGQVRVLYDGRGTARYPTFSRDGTRVAFILPVDSMEVGATDAIFAMDAGGGELVPLTDDKLAHPGLLTWSPDGATLAFEDGGRLWLANTDGSGAHPVDLGVTIEAELSWRPPDGRQLLFRGSREGMAGLFLADADGSHPVAITPLDGGTYDYVWTTWSPDGRRVAYHRIPARQTEILTIGEPEPVVIRPKDDLGIVFPRWSPDGTRLGVMVWDGGSTPTQLGVIPADDPTPTVTLTGPKHMQAIQYDWSPDGTQLLAVWWGTTEAWIIDPDGGPGVKADWTMAIPDWVEWQRKAR